MTFQAPPKYALPILSKKTRGTALARIWQQRIMLLERAPKLLVTNGKKLITHLNSTGTGGNSSILNREKKLITITPIGLEHLDTRPEDIVLLNPDGERQTAAQKVDQLFLPLLEMMLQPLALAKP